MGKTKFLGFALTIVFLGLVLWKTDLRELAVALSSANYLYVLPAALCTLVSYLLRTYRWQRILGPTKWIPFRSLLPVLMIGFMANNVLPARLGEFVRAYALGRKESISKTLGFATILLERLLDGVTLVAVLALLSLGVALPAWGQEIAFIASGIFLVAIVGVLVVLLRDDLAQRLIAVVVKPLPRATGAKLALKADSFIGGLDVLRRKRVVARLMAISAVIWAVEASFYFLTIRAFGVALSPSSLALAALMMLVVVNLGIMIPSAPGYVGTFQFFAVLALGTFGVQRELALSIAIVAHGVQYVLVTGLGLVFFWRENMSFKSLQAAAAEEPEQEALGVR